MKGSKDWSEERGRPVLKSYKDLIAWPKSFALCGGVYRASASFPPGERFGLTAQLRRSAVSIPSNIAEGFARSSTGNYLRFLAIAAGSVAELETQLMLARELGFGATEPVKVLLGILAEISRILNVLIRSLARRGDKK